MKVVLQVGGTRKINFEIRTGREEAFICSQRSRPLQEELPPVWGAHRSSSQVWGRTQAGCTTEQQPSSSYFLGKALSFSRTAVVRRGSHWLEVTREGQGHLFLLEKKKIRVLKSETCPGLKPEAVSSSVPDNLRIPNSLESHPAELLSFKNKIIFW